MERKSQFTNKLGFVLAAAGSAVGLGNIWRFPYLAARYGGGAFLVTYIVLAVTFGFSLMIAEIAIGRKTGKSPIGAFRALHARSGFIGVAASLVAFFILPYYSVIGGWVMKYLFSYLAGAGTQLASPDYFTSFISQSWQPVVWQALFVAATLAAILMGVQKGVEKASRLMMPGLIILSLVIAVYSLTLPGALEGLKYFLVPDFTGYSAQTVLAAVGQMFYSMSLAMGIMITYGSYMRQEDHLEQAVSHIEIFDTSVSLLAGLMIIPAVFAVSGNTTAVNAGPGLMFETLPQFFSGMRLGWTIGALFFLLVLFAALTSAISLMETMVATFCEHFHFTRRKSALASALLAVVLGVPSSLGFGLWRGFRPLGMSILDFFDFLTNSVWMPLVALATCILVGWVIGTRVVEDEVKLGGQFRREAMFRIMIRWIAPVLLVAILISSVLNSLGIIQL